MRRKKNTSDKSSAKIGGVPSFNTKMINIAFAVVIVVAGVLSIFSGEKMRLLMIELTTVMLSVEIIYMIHMQTHVNHFKFWILSAIEWRISEMMSEIKQIKESSTNAYCETGQ